jgi:L-fuculose-phosphate aldolase
MLMHLAIYRERDDLRAIVHAHPTAATGYAVAGRDLPAAVLAEIVTTLGCIPIARYGTPSTDELAAAVVGPIRNYDVLLLANHGALTTGDSLDQAEERMYQLEHFAQVSLVAELLGGPKAFSTEEVDRLSALREKAGGRPVPPACYPMDTNEETITLTKDELIALVADAVRTLR